MRYKNNPITWPLLSNEIRRNSESNTFGMVRVNSDKSPRPHQGWDFYAEAGTPCFAISASKIIHVESRGALGLMIVLAIADTGKYAAYCHLSSSGVSVGDIVGLGQQIGTTGNSGNAVSMLGKDQHLHFEIRNRPITGTGLSDRVSPLEVFGMCPIHAPVLSLINT